MKFRNILNVEEYPGEINNDPSETVQDQNMSIREIMVRFAKGLPTDAKEPIFHGEDEYVPDPRSLDLTERQEIKEKLEETIKSVKNKLNGNKSRKNDVSDGVANGTPEGT